MSGQPNIIWITADSVRQDRTTVGGHERDTTPRLADIAAAAEGRAYRNCFSSGIWTLASSGSILTGTYPSRNTVGVAGERLPDKLPTVAELLSEVGYRTACLSRNSHVSEASGLDRGFDRMAWLASSTLLSAAGPVTAAKYLLNIRRHSAGLTLDTAKHASPFIMNDVAKRWLNDLAGTEPFFLYLHYNEPHRPYIPPIPWQDKFIDEIDQSVDDATSASMDLHSSLYERIATGELLSDSEREGVLAMYDAEIAYTDECIGRLLRYVEDMGIGETWVVVTADHGELFGEQGVLAHHLVVDDALTNVPMVVRGLDLGVTEETPIGHVDVMRTMLEAVGANTSSLQGVDLRDGSPGYTITQRGPAEFEEYVEFNPEFDTERFHAGPLTALRTEEYKLVDSLGKRELFRVNDETIDISERSKGPMEELSNTLERWLENDGKPVGAARDGNFTDDMQEQLSQLGYLDR